jgi:hypothetical protein
VQVPDRRFFLRRQKRTRPLRHLPKRRNAASDVTTSRPLRRQLPLSTAETRPNFRRGRGGASFATQARSPPRRLGHVRNRPVAFLEYQRTVARLRNTRRPSGPKEPSGDTAPGRQRRAGACRRHAARGLPSHESSSSQLRPVASSSAHPGVVVHPLASPGSVHSGRGFRYQHAGRARTDPVANVSPAV